MTLESWARSEVRVLPGRPGVTELTDAVVTPVRSRRQDDEFAPSVILVGGVYDARGDLVRAALLRRRSKVPEMATVQDAPARFDGAAAAHIDGTCLFAGDLWLHYGHFLLETMARLWYLARYPVPDQVLFQCHSQGVTEYRHIPSYARDVLAAFGLDERRIRIVSRPTSVARLILPEPGFEMAEYMYEDHAEFLGRFSHAGKPMPTSLARLLNRLGRPAGLSIDRRQRHRKIYLSRSRLPSGLIAGETLLERVLADEGFAIVHPQDHDVRTQVDMLRAARAVIGFNGSAFNTNILADRLPARVYILCRNHMLPNRLLIDRAKGVRTVLIDHRVADSGHKSRSAVKVDLDACLADLAGYGVVSPGRTVNGTRVDAEYELLAQHRSLSQAGAPPDEMIEVLSELVAFRPDHAIFHRDLGRHLIDRDRHAEAEPIMRRAIALADGDARSHHLLSCVFERQGRLPEALAESRRAAALAPTLTHITVRATRLAARCAA